MLNEKISSGGEVSSNSASSASKASIIQSLDKTGHILTEMGSEIEITFGEYPKCS